MEERLWLAIKELQRTSAQLGDFTNKLVARTDKLKIRTNNDVILILQAQLKALHKTNSVLRGQNAALRLQVKELERAINAI